MTQKVKISLATKFALTFASLFLVTMLGVIFSVRESVISQFTTQYENTVAYSLQSIQVELFNRHERIKQQLVHLAEKIAGDNDFRLRILVRRDKLDPFVLDYARSYMSTMGLQVLEITNQQGVVLSSGHNRNSFGKKVEGLIEQLQSNPNRFTLSLFEDMQRKFACLTALKEVNIGQQLFYLIGGIELDPAFLDELKVDENQFVLVQLPDSLLSSSGLPIIEPLPDIISPENDSLGLYKQFEKEYSIGQFDALLLTDHSATNATAYVLHPKSELFKLLTNLNTRILVTSGLGLVFAIVLSVWLTRSVAKPLTRLASTANNLTLDTYDANFNVNGNDEVAVLGNALTRMLHRLNQSRLKLAVAEKKAAFAQIARQVNHDIKNGFTPIRHVMKHWLEVAENEPGKLAKIFNERKATVMESIDYMENLARSYARMKPETQLHSININEVLRNLLKGYETLHEPLLELTTDYDANEPHALADSTQLHRAFENILQNGLDAVKNNGKISITTSVEEEDIIITWKDNGCGIPVAIQKQLFTPYVTTKEDGSGLGLVNVKNIVEDFGGGVKIESQVGVGTTITMILPVGKD